MYKQQNWYIGRWIYSDGQLGSFFASWNSSESKLTFQLMTVAQVLLQRNITKEGLFLT